MFAEGLEMDPNVRYRVDGLKTSSALRNVKMCGALADANHHICPLFLADRYIEFHHILQIKCLSYYATAPT